MWSSRTVAAQYNKKAEETPIEDEENPPSGVRWWGVARTILRSAQNFNHLKQRIQMVRCRQKGTQKAVEYDSLNRKVLEEPWMIQL